MTDVARKTATTMSHWLSETAIARTLALVATVTLAGPAYAQGERVSVAGTSELLATFASLVAIVAAIVGIAWLVRRLHGARGGNGGVIQVLASQALGAKERVMLVDVAGEHLVIGVTASQIRTLHVLENTDRGAALDDVRPSFRMRLRDMVKGGDR